MKILLYDRLDVVDYHVKARKAREVINLDRDNKEIIKSYIKTNRSIGSDNLSYRVIVCDFESNPKLLFQEEIDDENMYYVNLTDNSIRLKLKYPSGVIREFDSNQDLMLEYCDNENCKIYFNDTRIDNQPKGYQTKKYNIRHITD